VRGTGVSVTVLCPGVTITGFQERAQVGNMRLLQGPAMSAEQVARIGYQAMQRGQAVVTPGFFNQLMPLTIRFTPRWLAAAWRAPLWNKPVAKMLYTQTVTELIKQRFSCRAYLKQPLAADMQRQLAILWRSPGRAAGQCSPFYPDRCH